MPCWRECASKSKRHAIPPSDTKELSSGGSESVSGSTATYRRHAVWSWLAAFRSANSNSCTRRGGLTCGSGRKDQGAIAYAPQESKRTSKGA